MSAEAPGGGFFLEASAASLSSGLQVVRINQGQVSAGTATVKNRWAAVVFRKPDHRQTPKDSSGQINASVSHSGTHSIFWGPG
jgi:hypothetical protein